ncbi:siderophore-interacting protein [Methylocaldum marinum]|uniref:siderophore-interacting protein n=1 Tax=Methylocaldum marinum TaxID=1432792 RepID=UPI000E6A4E5D|nr:siderophore-interacting protein [Methylocaldum marinum]
MSAVTAPPLSRHPTRPRRLTVRQTERLSPHLLRVRFFSEELHDFPDAGPGAHLKLFVPSSGVATVLPTIGPSGPEWPEGPRPASRTYSLRRFDRSRRTLDIDFVLHGDDGPASRWAARARAGDSIGLAGTGGPRLSRADADFHLLAGDLTALPAIAAVLENLPASARGAVLIEVEDAGDELDLRHPPGVKLRWLRGSAPGRLPDAVRGIDWTSSARIFATVAGENDAVLAIRRHLRRDRGVPAESLYAVPYWRRGRREEDYHDERHRLMETDS